jgi:hypothetical protein
MKTAFVLAAFVLVGCTAQTEPSASSQSQLASCDSETERVGTYMMTLTEQAGGTCGAVPPSLVTFAPGDGVGQGCTLEYENASEGGCKIERAVKCRKQVRDDTVYGGYGVVDTEVVGVSRQVTQDGSRIEGTVTVSANDGRDACLSTYSVVWVRQ